MNDQDYRGDRDLRNRARGLFRTSLSRVQEDRSAMGLAQRAGRRAADGARGMAQDAGAFTRQHPRAIAVGAAGAGLAAAIWLARAPITRFIARYLPKVQGDDGETDAGDQQDSRDQS